MMCRALQFSGYLVAMRNGFASAQANCNWWWRGICMFNSMSNSVGSPQAEPLINLALAKK